MPFSVDDLKEYEKEQVAQMDVNDDELGQVSGGEHDIHAAGGVDINLCKGIGMGMGGSWGDGYGNICFLVGYSGHDDLAQRICVFLGVGQT